MVLFEKNHIYIRHYTGITIEPLKGDMSYLESRVLEWIIWFKGFGTWSKNRIKTRTPKSSTVSQHCWELFDMLYAFICKNGMAQLMSFCWTLNDFDMYMIDFDSKEFNRFFSPKGGLRGCSRATRHAKQPCYGGRAPAANPSKKRRISFWRGWEGDRDCWRGEAPFYQFFVRWYNNRRWCGCMNDVNIWFWWIV